MNFYKTPFLYLTPLLIFGVLFGETISVSFGIVTAIFVVVALVGLKLNWVSPRIQIALLVLLVFLVGTDRMQETRAHFQTIQVGDLPRIARVDQAEHSDKTWKKVILTIQQEKIGSKWRSADEQILCFSTNQFQVGDVICMRTSLEPIKNSGNPGEFDAQNYWKAKNIGLMCFLNDDAFRFIGYEAPNGLNQWFYSVRNSLSQSLQNALDPDEAAIAKALLLGDKNDLSAEVRQSFGTAGAMHVLAISGLHVGIIMYLLFFVFQRFSRWISRNQAVLFTVLILWIFAGITGGAPSVLRATFMFSVVLVGQQLGRSGNSVNTLFFSAFVLLVLNPLLVFDIGFQLSYGAMLGIFMWYQPIRKLLVVKQSILARMWEGTALGIAAQVFTIPLVLYHFHQFPNYFWLSNLGIMALAGVILGLGLLFFTVQSVPLLGSFVALGLGLGILVLLIFMQWIETLPAALARGFSPTIYQILIFYTCLAMLILGMNYRKLRWIAFAGLALLFVQWQWTRYEGMTQEEIVVLNSRQPIVLIKLSDKIIAFYDGKVSDREKVTYLVRSYTNVCPVPFEIYRFKEGVTTVQCGGKKITLRKEKKLISLDGLPKKYRLRTGYGVECEPDAKVIDMSYLQQRSSNYHLSKGAFRIPI